MLGEPKIGEFVTGVNKYFIELKFLEVGVNLMKMAGKHILGTGNKK